MDRKDKHFENIISKPKNSIPEIKGLGQTLFERMRNYKNKIAHTCALTGETQTFEEVLKATIRTAITMRLEGIEPNDVVAICSFNSLNSFIPYYASFFIGAIPAYFHPWLPLTNATYLLGQVCPKMVFASSDGIELMENGLKGSNIDSRIVFIGEGSDHPQFSKFKTPYPDEEDNFEPYEVKDAKETALIVFSSGTTDLPKGICLTHYGLLANLYESEANESYSTVMTFNNPYWISAVTLVLVTIFHGYNRLIYPTFIDDQPIWELLEKYKVNLLFLNPHQATDICKNGRPKTIDTSALKGVILGGGPLSMDQMNQFRECFNFPATFVLNMYGLTEAHGFAFSFTFDDMHDVIAKPDSVGKPMSGFSYKVVDPDTTEILGPNQKGELWIKTDIAMAGYYKADSSAIWDADGFFTTGDVVYYDENQCFFIADRLKDILKYKMFNFTPFEIEAVFYTHPFVRECAVIGITDPVVGDLLMGIVVLKESAVGKITEKELEEYVNGKVEDAHKIREGVKFVKELPLTVTEKINRRETKRLVLEGKI